MSAMHAVAIHEKSMHSTSLRAATSTRERLESIFPSDPEGGKYVQE